MLLEEFEEIPQVCETLYKSLQINVTQIQKNKKKSNAKAFE
jgi:hypothetical protein